jgi:hypothetical protein
MHSLHPQSNGKTGINGVDIKTSANLHMGKTGKNGIDDMISAALYQTMPVIDGIDDMISATLCTKINATLPLQFDDALNLLLSVTVLVMAEWGDTKGEHHKSKSANAREHTEASEH